MGKSIFIVGPTASGKTNFAIKVANIFHGELINADSIQVYKGLDIISGKDVPLNAQFKSIPIGLDKKYTFGCYPIGNTSIYLLDIVSPSYQFNVADFITCSRAALQYLDSKLRLPLVVGGTYYYIKALLDGVDTLTIPPNPSLREKLKDEPISFLQEMLSNNDPKKFSSMNNSDRNNPRRLIRAIEIAKSDVVSTNLPHTPPRESLLIGLRVEKDVLRKKIDQRVDERLKMGALEEVDYLYKIYDRLSPNVKNANGYLQLFSYIKGEISFEEAIQQWKYSEYQTSKKQLTFLRNDKRIIWLDPLDRKSVESITTTIESFTSINE